MNRVDARCLRGGLRRGLEGFLGCADGEPVERGGVLTAFAGGGEDDEAEGGLIRRSAGKQRELLAAGQDVGEVGEAAVAGDLDFVQLPRITLRQRDLQDGAAEGLHGVCRRASCRRRRRWEDRAELVGRFERDSLGLLAVEDELFVGHGPDQCPVVGDLQGSDGVLPWRL